MKNTNIRLFAIFSLVIFLDEAAQKQCIPGTVTLPSDGVPFAGVSIVIQDRNTPTAFDGNYAIQASAETVFEFFIFRNENHNSNFWNAEPDALTADKAIAVLRNSITAQDTHLKAITV